MSVINRVRVANFLNMNGDNESVPWAPRYRCETLNFYGQSTAINMTNGGGKTSITDAMLAILSRDPVLITATRRKMSPAQLGVHSHIQIELLVHSSSVVQSDFIVTNGGQAQGETWVFGMCGHRGANQTATFYYYPGTLEDFAPAQRVDDRTILLPNRALSETRKSVRGFVWNVTSEEWRAALSQHVSLSSMRRMAEYQKKGGGDKSAELFNFKPRPGEAFGTSFFYEIIAPELLSGVMDVEGDEGEHEFEDTILNTVGRVLNAKRSTKRKRDQLENARTALSAVKLAAEAGTDWEKAAKEFSDKLGQLAFDVTVLKQAVVAEPLPGVPNAAALPQGPLREVAAELIVEPGRPLRITDRGLGILIAQPPKAVNQLAERNNILCRKLPQVIEITCDLKDAQSRKGHGNTSYTLLQADEILLAATTFSTGLTRFSTQDLLQKAERWFEDPGDTNPLRGRLLEMSYDIDDLERKVKEHAEKIEISEQSFRELAKQKQEIEASETAYQDLKRSGLFTDAELDAPKTAASRVRDENRAAEKAIQELAREHSRLEALQPLWDDFIARHPGETPEAVEQYLLALEKEAEAALTDAQLALEQTADAHTATLENQSKISGELIKLRQKRERFAELEAQVELYRVRFTDEDPQGLDDRVLEDQRVLESNLNSERKRASGLERALQDLARFREQAQWSDSPAAWLREIEHERSALVLEVASLTAQINNTQSARAALETEHVAPTPVAQQALDQLTEAGIEYVPLFAVIEAAGLAEQKREQALSSFSAMLFAPVVSDEEAAAKSAMILADAELPVAVLIKSDVLAHLAADSIRAGAIERLARGLVAGVRTRSVECLLDPTLIEREKRALDEKLLQLRSRREIAELRRSQIGSEAELVVLARSALNAVESNADTELPRVRDRIERYQEQVPLVLARADRTSLDAIRAMQAYLRLGADTELERLEHALVEGQVREKALTRELSRLTRMLEELQPKMKELQRAKENAFPVEVRVLLPGAKQFAKAGGPSFMAAYPTTLDQRNQRKNVAEQRAEWAHDLIRAQGYVDARRAEEQGVSLLEQLRQLEDEIEQSKAQRDTCSAQLDALREQVPQLTEAVMAIEEAALAVIHQYRRVASVSDEVGSVLIDAQDVERSALAQAGQELRTLVQGSDPDLVATVDAARHLLDTARALEIERDAADARRLKLASDEALKRYMVALDAAEAPEARLAPAERDKLREVREAASAQGAREMAEQMRAVFDEVQNEFQHAEAAEEKSRGLVAERLTYFIDTASMNLATFRAVAGRKHGGINAHFDVDAEVISAEKAKDLVESVIARLEEEENHRERVRARSGSVEENEEEKQQMLRSVVRSMTYRNIFLNPAVRFVNAAIRLDGGKHELSTKLSTGQKTAIALMWSVRLAEYAVEREAQRARTSSARRKMRERAENILIIDGLFSDLSNRTLIKSAMSGIEGTRGRFQLIGLIHNEHYENDFEHFPVLINGKQNVALGRSDGWVSFEEADGTLKPRSPAPDALGTISLSEHRLERERVH